MTTTAPIPSCDFDAIMAKRNRTHDAHARIVAAADSTDDPIHLFVRHRGGMAALNSALAVEIADYGAWHELIQASGLWSFLDAEARAKWNDDWEKLRLPPFTQENAESLLRGLHDQRELMCCRGVSNLWRRLSGDYKTNEGMRFNRRMILTHALEVWGVGKQKHASPHHATTDLLDDLDRMLCLLQGQPEPDHRSGNYHRMRAALVGDAPWTMEGRFLTVRLFRNGNGHATFRDDADVDRLNLVLAYGERNAIGGPR